MKPRLLDGWGGERPNGNFQMVNQRRGVEGWKWRSQDEIPGRCWAVEGEGVGGGRVR